MRAERPVRGAWVATVAIVVGVLAAWEAAARTGLVSAMAAPPPTVVVGSLIELVVSGQVVSHLIATLGRVSLGVLVGCVPACLLGLLMGWSAWLRSALDPLVAALHPLPKIAILPLLMIVLGIGEAPKVAVIAVAAFFPMLLSAMAGVRQISPELFEVARCYGAGPVRTFARVVLPGSLPLVLAGLRLALNVGLLVAVAAEMVAGDHGLGTVLWLAWETARPERVYAYLVVTAALGVTINILLGVGARKAAPWAE